MKDTCHLVNEEANRPVCSTSDLLLYMYSQVKIIGYQEETPSDEDFKRFLSGVRLVDALEPLLQLGFSEVSEPIDASAGSESSSVKKKSDRGKPIQHFDDD